MKKSKKEVGITLIALTITIIILLILAGLTIAAITGENGIIKRTVEAKEKTEETTLEEKIKLLMAENIINEYTGENEEKTAQELQKELNEQGENVLVIQWDKYIIFDLDKNKEYRVLNDGSTEYWGESTIGQKLLNTKTANANQISQEPSTSNLIGIDNNGNTVNMCCWEYGMLDNGTYALASDETLLAIKEQRWSDITCGYIGNIDENGKIQENMPQFISVNNGENYLSVTSLPYTFVNMKNVFEIEELPETVVDLSFTFLKSGLKTISEIPKGTKIMYQTFYNCENLQKIGYIGEGVENMQEAFRNCIKLNEISNLPTTVTNMYSTFRNCKSLEEAPLLPPNVIDISLIFSECSNLKFVESIPPRVTKITNAFNSCTQLSGTINIYATDIPYDNSTGAFWHTGNIILKVVRGSITEQSMKKLLSSYSQISIEYLE